MKMAHLLADQVKQWLFLLPQAETACDPTSQLYCLPIKGLGNVLAWCQILREDSPITNAGEGDCLCVQQTQLGSTVWFLTQVRKAASLLKAKFQ